MNIAATSDIHCPEYLELYVDVLKDTSFEPEYLLLAGDIVDKNKVLLFKHVYDVSKKRFPNTKIIAIFGNEEYKGYERLYEELYRDVLWLNDNYVKIDEGEICVIGTRGGLDKPTPWQARNIPGIERYYFELPYKIEKTALDLKKTGCKKIILLSHYGVTSKNLIGEKPEIYPHLACTRFEKIIRRDLFDLVIHGHVHYGTLEVVYVRDVPVYNVSLPARRKLIEIKI